jgi:glycosyltransferase involved in cell wall biosynthesis
MTQNPPITISVVIPMHNEEGNLPILFEKLTRILEDLGVTYEIICINDGSRDQTLEHLIEFHHQDARIKVINLSRNFGKEIALTAGIDAAQGNGVIPIDADLQDPPELIYNLVKKWREGYDVVYATRNYRRDETWLKRFTAHWFYVVIERISPVPIPKNTGDFRLMDRKVVDALKTMPERTRFMKGLFAWVGYRQTAIFFDRPERKIGKTSWNYWRLWNFALGGIVSFSLVPLQIWIYIGFSIAFSAFTYASFLVVRTIVSGIDVPGYASLMVAILFLGGVQLITLGVMGEYIGRIYEEVKGRPLYLVRDRYGFKPEPDIDSDRRGV